MSDIKVSVLMTTYNHEAFIVQAIEGVLMQETDFAFELLIGEDCSTDQTREIVLEYAKRFPNRIQVISPMANEGGNCNFSRLLAASRGSYIAWIEGDDYWIDPEKLQLQTDFLDANPEFAICFHSVYRVYEDGSERLQQLTNEGQAWMTTIEDLCRGNYIETASVMYRKSFETLPDWLIPLPIGDWPINILHAQYGKIGYINRPMSVYRIHNCGIWTSRPTIQRFVDCITAAEVCNKMLQYRYEPYFNFSITRWSINILQTAWRTRSHFSQAWQYFLKLLRISLKQPLVVPCFLRRRKYYQRLRNQCAHLKPKTKVATDHQTAHLQTSDRIE